MTTEKGELATSVKKSENEIPSLIAFIFGVLVNVSKKIVCLQCGFKS